MAIKVGDTVQHTEGWYGVVRTYEVGVNYPVVELLPDFASRGNGWVCLDSVDNLTVVNGLCACAYLGYRERYVEGGNVKTAPTVFSTGCDFKRRVGRGRTFLPGHDAKTKSLLVKAWGHEMVMGTAHSIDVAQEFGFSVAVAAGIQKAQERGHKRVLSKRQNSMVERPKVPQTPEHEMTPAQLLQRQLKVTAPMMEAMAYALVRNDGYVAGTPTGTVVAMQKRGLVEWGEVTTLGRRVMDFDDLEVDKVVCTSDQGLYANHTGHYECKRCGEVRDGE